MKKLFMYVSAAVLLLASCAKEEVANLTPQNVETGDAITFTINDETTKAEYQLEGSDWETYWYSEEDHIALLYADAAITPAGVRIQPATTLTNGVAYGPFFSNVYGWATTAAWNAVGAPVDMPVMTFKATRTAKQGVFTGVDDANRLFFPATLRATTLVKPSFRMYYPASLVAQFDATNLDKAADGATPIINLAVPATNVQYQNDLTSTSTWAINEGLMLPSDPTVFNNIANAGTGRSANTAFPLNLKRQFHVLYTSLDNYDETMFGKLQQVELTAQTSDIVYDSPRSVNIYNLVNGAYPIAAGATKAKVATLNVNGGLGAGMNWEDDAKLYIAVDPFTSVANEDFSVKYTFDNISITRTFSMPTAYTFAANGFSTLGVLDFAKQPYYVLSDNGIAPYTLVINPCFYDEQYGYNGIEDIFTTVAGADFVVNLDGTNVAVADFTKVFDLANQPFDAAEITALEKLVNITEATYDAPTQTMIPVYPAITDLTMDELTSLESTVITDLNGMVTITDLSLGKLTTVPANAFAALVNLDVVKIQSATEIGETAFPAAGALLEMSPNPVSADILISDKLTTIGKEALTNLATLQEVMAPGVTAIGEKAFFGCAGLTKLVLMSVADGGIADDAFGQTQVPYNSAMNIETLIMPAYNFNNAYVRSHLIKSSLEVADLTSVTDFYERLDAVSGVKLQNYINLETLVIGEGAKLHTRALSGCVALKNIDLRKAAMIAEEACMGCTSLTTLNLNVNVGQRAFQGCTSVTSLTFGDNVTTIDANAFEGVGAAAGFDVTLNLVSKIGANAFKNSTVKGITLKNVSTLGAGAFDGCATLIGKYEARRDKNVLYVGAAVIPTNAFRGCSAVEIFDFESATGVIVNNGSVNTNAGAPVVINFYGQLTVAGSQFISMDYTNPAAIVENGTAYTVNFKNGISNGTVNAATRSFTATIGANNFAYTVTKVNTTL